MNVWQGTFPDENTADDGYLLTAPAKEYEPSRYGLYNMCGNVWEWVSDCGHTDYEDAPKDGSSWLEANRGDCGKRVLRGGSWYNGSSELRTALRYWNLPVTRNGDLGFRLAQDLEQ